MATLRLHDPAFVVSAVREYDHLGREGFLRQYGYGRARRYYLLLNGKLYDSKAVCGVAFGMENPNLGPLASSEFSGGESTVARVLESLGFTVVRQGREETTSATTPLVLVENEVTMGGEVLALFAVDQATCEWRITNLSRNPLKYQPCGPGSS